MTTVAAGAIQGTQLFNRALSLVVGFPNDPDLDVKVALNTKNAKGVDLSKLRVDFRVEKSLKPTEPNTCSVQVWNLSESTRNSLSGGHNLTVRLEAGYTGQTAQLYFAEVRSAHTTREGPDFITHLESQDTVAKPSGVRRTKKPQPGIPSGSVYVTTGPKVPLDQAFRTITQALGIGEGNLKAALANANGAKITSVNASALLGNGAQRMTDLCRSAGLEWSIQDGNLQLLNIGQALSTSQAILISPDTGMVESPQVASDGSVTVKTLLIPGLLPGTLVVVDSLFVKKGGYRVEKVRYVGSTWTENWYCEFDAARY